MAITAADISKLRAATGAGMMDCKKALDEANGDMELAGEILRKKGVVKAAKRADKIAAEGLVIGVTSVDAKVGALVEVNCETDFVAKSDDFIKFTKDVMIAVDKNNPADLGALNATKLDSGETVAEALAKLTIKIGEKVSVRRFGRYESKEGKVFMYIHGTKIGVLLELVGGDDGLGVDLAMQVAAANPKYLDRTTVSTAALDKEREIYAEQLRAQKKPENIIENILKGKVEKYYEDVCLVDQVYVKDEEKKVKDLLAKANAKIVRFARMELGEGIEKKVTDFAAEVAEQLK